MASPEPKNQPLKGQASPSRPVPTRRSLLALVTVTRTVKLISFLGLFTATICEIRECNGFSMMPTINYNGHLVLVSALPYWSPQWMHLKRRVERGDVVTAASPTNPRDTVCKRVIGVAGDIVEVDPRRGEGMIYSQNASGAGLLGQSTNWKGRGWIKVPKGQVWLAGDNTSNSTDSRDYGPVPLALIRGRVIAKVGQLSSVKIRADLEGLASSLETLPD